MIPTIVKDFTWHQSPTAISIVVPMQGLVPHRTDVLTSSNYIRINCQPSIFEAFLYGTVDETNGTCTLDQEKQAVFLNFPKCSGEEVVWPSLEAQGLDRQTKKTIRENAVTLTQQRHQQDAEAISNKREELRKASVLEQIRMDEELRNRVAATKSEEAKRALANINRWTDEGTMEAGETVSKVIAATSSTDLNSLHLCDGPGGQAVAERMAKRRPFPAKPACHGEESLDEVVRRGPVKTSLQKEYSAEEARHHMEAKMQLKKFDSIWPELSDVNVDHGGDGDTEVAIRQPQRITVHFTPREFPTPARESSSALEEEWLKKQAESRKMSGFNEPDLRPEERNPDWLIEKGKSLMKTESLLGAVSAFSLGIKLAPKMPELYRERAKAHLRLRNYMKTVDDSSAALEMYTPKVPSNAMDRRECLITRGESFKALEMYKESLRDLEEAARITSADDDQIKQRIEEVKTALQAQQNDGSSDSD